MGELARESSLRRGRARPLADHREEAAAQAPPPYRSRVLNPRSLLVDGVKWAGRPPLLSAPLVRPPPGLSYETETWEERD